MPFIRSFPFQLKIVFIGAFSRLPIVEHTPLAHNTLLQGLYVVVFWLKEMRI